MFKKIHALMLLCAIPWIIGMTKPVRAEYIGINELQTEANIEWKKDYVDRYGRTVSVDVTPIIPQVDKVPIQIMENQILPVENVLNICSSALKVKIQVCVKRFDKWLMKESCWARSAAKNVARSAAKCRRHSLLLVVCLKKTTP